MIYECAPMDGVTDFLFRQIQSRHFAPADLYYTPFLSLTVGHGFQEKEYNEMDPEKNRGLQVIPQLIGNNADDILWGIQEIADLGYEEVNLNMGCPSQTVVRKSKGAGMLADLEETTRILDRIYENASIGVSLKVRIGMEDPAEFRDLLTMMNRFPVRKLIIHPRVRTQGYGGAVHYEIWEEALAESKAPLSYSGDLFDRERVEAFRSRYPQVETLMIGRGLVSNPALIGEAKGEAPLDTARMKAYHQDLYEVYREHMGKERYTIDRMKELWGYMGMSFADCKEALRQVRRSITYAQYEEAVEALFDTCPIRSTAGFQKI